MHVRIDSARTRGSALEKSIAEFVLGKNSSIKSEFDSGLEEGEINEGASYFNIMARGKQLFCAETQLQLGCRGLCRLGS